MWNILVLASATIGSGGERGTGDLFDFALTEVIRALDVPAQRAVVLVPWSFELAPFVAAGTIGTAPSIDPQDLGAGPSGLLPYYPPSAVPSAQDLTLYRATHMTFGRGDAPLPFAVALKRFPPTHVLVLSSPKEFHELGGWLRAGETPILTFGSLARIEEVADALSVPSSRVANLEQTFVLPPEDDDTAEFPELGLERQWEAELEPYIPFGLLVQKYFEAMLADDGLQPPTEPR
jgi:hypothetical protein